MGRPIPEIRRRLYELAELHGIPELRELADDTIRNSPVRKARKRRRRLTPDLAQQIREYAALNPTMQMNDIGDVFNVNQGRVSEALNRLV